MQNKKDSIALWTLVVTEERAKLLATLPPSLGVGTVKHEAGMICFSCTDEAFLRRI